MFSRLTFRLYPNIKQQQSLAAQFGCARYVWNDALALTQKIYRETGKGVGYSALQKRLPLLKKELPWLADADSQALQMAIQNLASAFENFFRGRTRYPRYKSKCSPQAVHYPQRVKLGGKRIYLPKVGWVTTVIHREILGAVKTVTVSKKPCGHYYASVLIDDGQPLPPVSIDGKAIGIDLGLIDFAVTSDGSKYSNPRHIKRAEKNLKRKQRKLSRKKKSSNSRNKARLKLARAHERLANARRDYLHKLSRRIVNENQVIAVEDLHVKGMMKNPNLAKAISDAGWGTFTRFVEYKAARAGKAFLKVDRWFPSSKACSECGAIQETMPLNARMWSCVSCSKSHDRDTNAARNIRDEAKRLLAAGMAAPAGGGDVRRARGRKSSTHAIACEAGNPTAQATG